MTLSDRFIRNDELIAQVRGQWVEIGGLLTYAGFRKSVKYREFDELFGEGNWLPVHSFEGVLVSRYQGYLMYEEAYYHFLKDNPEIRDWLVRTASEVFDIQPSNIECGLDYTAQECGATHLQDISVRRVLTRLTLEEQGITPDPENLPVLPVFRGDHPVQIRDHTTEGYILNPGKVPFHRPDLAIGEYCSAWWDENSAEDVYQRNKVLLVNPDALRMRIHVASQRGFLLIAQDKNIYEYAPGCSNILRYRKPREAKKCVLHAKFLPFTQILASPALSYNEATALAEAFAQRADIPRVPRLKFHEFLIATGPMTTSANNKPAFDLDTFAVVPFDLKKTLCATGIADVNTSVMLQLAQGLTAIIRWDLLLALQEEIGILHVKREQSHTLNILESILNNGELLVQFHSRMFPRGELGFDVLVPRENVGKRKLVAHIVHKVRRVHNA